MDKESILKNYKQNAKELNQILNEWDFLLAVPDDVKDEYECLINPILNELNSGTTIPKLALKINNCVERHYGYCPSKTAKYAKKIFTWWENKNI